MYKRLSQLHSTGIALATVILTCRPVFAETPVNYHGLPLYLGDPDVYVYDDYIYLTGTADDPNSTVCSFNKEICIFRTKSLSSSTNSDSWEPFYKYNPSLEDPLHDYCKVWAPDLAFNYFSSHWELRFTARQIPKGGSCVNETAQSVFMTTEALGAPILYRDRQTSGPRAWKTDNGCPASKATPPPVTPNIDCMRLDDDYYDGYISYVWYAGNPYYDWTLTGGNAIAITSLNSIVSPQRAAVGQVCTADRCFNYEEGVNEAPDLYRHTNNYYYLFYSSGNWDRHYAVRYLKSYSVSDLERDVDAQEERPIILFPQYNEYGDVVESRGHTSTVLWAGSPKIFYHKTVPGQPRTVHYETLNFDPANNNEPWPLRHLLHSPPAGVKSLRLHRSGTNYCVHNASGWTIGLALQQQPCNIARPRTQIFDAIKVSVGNPAVGPYYYMVRNRESGYCMDIQNNSSNTLTPVVQWHCHGADNQLWNVVSNPYNPSMFRLQSKLNPTLCASFPFGQTNMATAECGTAFWFYRD